MIEEAKNKGIPEINRDTVLFMGQEYRLIHLSDKGVAKTGTSPEIAQNGLLAIEGNTIWCYAVPDEYLPYVLINEILCLNVLEAEGHCLYVLQNNEIGEAVSKFGDEFILWRIKFFQSAEKYWNEIGNNKKYASEMKKCYEWLEGFLERRQLISDTLGGVSDNLS